MTKHTPGPWHWIAGDESTHRELMIEPGENSILYHGSDWPMKEANARLIAAAPELLAAVHAAVDGIDSTAPWAVKCRAAIAKATGEQP